MKHVLTIISCSVVLSMSAQETIFDTIPSEYLACEGQSFKMLWLPSYVSVYDSEENWYVAIQNYLDLSDYAGATLIHAQYQEILANNCWCWYDPEFMTSYDPVSCDCCSGDATRPFVDYLIVSYQANPCNYLGSHAQELLCSGCTTPSAVNYDENALYDDGSCEFAEDFDGIAADLDFDGVVGVADLLILLAAFGDTDLDFDGIYDSVDDCVGVFDECGVCNGDGPSVQILEDITILYDSVYAEQIDQWFVFEVGADSTFVYECEVLGCIDQEAGNYSDDANTDDGSCYYGPEQCGGALTIDYDGYSYELVAIGDQCWFAENLRTEHYSNGDVIAGNLSDSQWASTSSGAQAVYGNNDANVATYGRLYNWFAVDDSRGICPSGWIVPSDGEWTELIDFLGGSWIAGAVMKASSSDLPSWNGTNASGFSALAGGSRDYYGYFFDGGSHGYWWSSSPYGSQNAWLRYITDISDEVVRVDYGKGNGLSVRCVLD